MPHLGNLEYHILSDGVAYADGGGPFGLVPRVIWEQMLPPDKKNRVPIAINCLLIYSEGQTIVVDTGYGNKLSEKFERNAGIVRDHGDLLADLQRHDVAPEDVDIVINTHLHADHCGGNTLLFEGAIKPTFPNAEYMVQRLEYSDAIVPNERTRATYFADNFLPLYQSGQMRLLRGDTQITKNVRTMVTRGHTRAHQVVILESNGEAAMFMADAATYHYHLERLAWVTAFDVEPLESIETKRHLQQWALEHDALLIFQHDTQITTGKLQSEGRRFKVVAVDEEA